MCFLPVRKLNLAVNLEVNGRSSVKYSLRTISTSSELHITAKRIFIEPDRHGSSSKTNKFSLICNAPLGSRKIFLSINLINFFRM